MRLRVSPGARAAVLRRCGGACERCGLQWPWALQLFLVAPDAGPRAVNLVALCLPCSAPVEGPFAPLLAQPSLRDRLRARNNARTGAPMLTDGARRRLIALRGSCCEACGVSGEDRQLDVHHLLGVFRGGDDSPENLMVLCFVCHHHLRPCAAGCGRWAKKPATLCRRCRTERRLEELRAAVRAASASPAESEPR